MTNPTGEAGNGLLRLDFDRRVMLHFRGSVVTSDAGLLAYRELDDALGLSTSAGERLADTRTGKNGRHTLTGMLRQAVSCRLAGYEDVNDADRLRHDPAMRCIVRGNATKGLRRPVRWAASRRTGWRAARTSRRSPISRVFGSTVRKAPSTQACRARYGFKREPDARRAREQRLERALPLQVLSSALCV